MTADAPPREHDHDLRRPVFRAMVALLLRQGYETMTGRLRNGDRPSPNALDQPGELRDYYRRPEVVKQYIARHTAQPLNGLLHRSQVRFLNRMLTMRAPQRVLEIAPGPARLTAELQLQGRGVAIDASREMPLAARAWLRQRSDWVVLQGDAFRLPFSARSFDFVLSLKLIRHFQLSDRCRLYDEVRRVLVPGGAFVLDAQNRAVSLPYRQRKGVDRYVIFDALYDRDELTREGFRVLHVEGIVRHHTLQRWCNRLRRVGLAGPAAGLVRALERVPSRSPSKWMILVEAL